MSTQRCILSQKALKRGERNEAITHYMDDPLICDRFLSQLLAALGNPTYVCRSVGFDWARFAREFSAPDFDPPLEKWELFMALAKHFSPPGRRKPPTNRIWWAVRIITGCSDPDKWLLTQRRQRKGNRWAVEVARLLGCNLSAGETSRYVSRQALGTVRPRIPSSLKTHGKRVLALVEGENSNGLIINAWGFVCAAHERWSLVWKASFRDEVLHLPELRGKPAASLRDAMQVLIRQRGFHPDVTLFYTGRWLDRRTGQPLWSGFGELDLESMDIDRTGGPILVQAWDEDGWPVGRRLSVR